MNFAKRLVLALLAIVVWVAVAAYGAFSGWFLSPIAPQGDSAAFLKAAAELAEDRSRGNIALALIQKGTVHGEVFSPSVDRIDRETIFPLASASKWVTAYGVMQLVQAGKIDLDAPVSKYLTRWQLPAGSFDNSGVTVRRLLSHTAGLSDGLGFGDYRADEVVPTLEESLKNPRASSGTKVIAVGRPPGTEWNYSGGGYLILQLVVEEVSGMAFAEWIQKVVFDPVGMRRSTYEYLDELENTSKSYAADGKPAPLFRYASQAATGLSSSTGDLIKLVQAQSSSTTSTTSSTGAQLLSPENVAAMRQPHGRQFGVDIWGLGVMLYAPTAGGDYVFGHDGSNDPAINSAVRMNPDNGDAIIVLVTGNSRLASLIAYEWTVWQTGTPDFLMVDKVIESAFTPVIVGLLLIVALFVFFTVKDRRNRNRRPR